jgi:hypothetical protein
MSKPFAEKVRIERAGAAVIGGAQDPNTGVWTSTGSGTGAKAIYDGACDAQDKGRVLARDQQGNPTVTADLSLFLGIRGAVGKFQIQQDDVATVTWTDGTTTTGQVLRADRLDDSVYLRRT